MSIRLSICIAIALLSSACGGGSSGSGDRTGSHSSAKPATGKSTDSADSAARETGSVARAMLAAGSYESMENFDKHGVRVGADVGSCTELDPKRSRDGLVAAVLHEDGAALEASIDEDRLLVASCGGHGYALVAWKDSKGKVFSLNEYLGTPGGSWAPSPEKYPACGIPADLAKLWDLDLSFCGG